ncbi:MAG: beta/gamma crystallin-related protein [Hyphomonas sp.]|nr:beta/gamma crystallin family protein [Hyphomonas sp.]MCB9970861.1 beta/gamma crystallin family protein [Hyphomonas sp.]
MLTIASLRTGLLAAAGLAALALPAAADHGPGRYQGQGDYGAYGNQGGYGGAVLYSNAGYSGQGIQIDGAVPDLARLRFNDRASSITIRSGAWQVCTDANFRGRCEIIDTSTPRLADWRLNDNISSLRPAGYGSGYADRSGYGNYGQGGYRQPGAWNGSWGGSLVLFPDTAGRGQPVEISSDVPDLANYRFNDRASSFLVTGGTWLVCEHANYQGRCEVLSRGEGDLRQMRMNDNISSIRRYDGRR